MKTTVSKSALTDVLRKVLNAVSTKTTIPVLNNVLLQADEQGLLLSATDLEVFMRSRAAGVTEREGRTTLPARKFAQIIGALPEGDVTLETNENEQTAISCEKSFFRIVGMESAEFPTEEEVESNWSFTLPAAEFRKILNKVSYAASTDETRHVLNGILLSIRSSVLTTVGTDGRRLALVERALEEGTPGDVDVILPPKLVTELERVLEEDHPLTIQLSESRAAFTVNETRIVSKLVEGSYPNYRQVIPDSFSKSAVFPREVFGAVLNRVAMVVSESSSSVNMELKDTQATLSANSAEVGEGNEAFEISYDGEPVEISFNPLFLMDPLKHLESDQVVLQFNDEYSPVSVSGDEGFLYVIMPMRS